MWWSTLICPKCGAELVKDVDKIYCPKCGWKPLRLLTDDHRREIEKSGCPHIGVIPPERFNCIDCEDNAAKCNCTACMGTFCPECNKVLSVDCYIIVLAYRETHEDYGG